MLRFSCELSRYNAEIYHIPGEENVVSDVLSRQHSKIETLKGEDISNATLSEKDSIKLVKRLTLPQGFKLEKEEVEFLLKGRSPPAVEKKTAKKTKAVVGKRLIKNTPSTLSNKKLNLPKTTKYRPGMLLPANMMTNIENREDTSDSQTPPPILKVTKM